MMRKYILYLFLLFCTLPLFAEYSRDMYEFLVFVNTDASITDIEKKIEEYEEKYKNSLYEYTEVVLSKYQIFSEYTQSRDILAGLTQLDKRWTTLVKTRDLTSDEYMVWADVKNQRMRYVPLKQLIKDSKLSYEYYNKAIDLDKNNTVAYIKLGIWSIYAPKIGGGGIDKAIKYLKKAVALSRNDFDVYNAYLWLSQAYFKDGNSKEHSKALEKARGVFGETVFYEHVERLNKNGKIIGE